MTYRTCEQFCKDYSCKLILGLPGSIFSSHTSPLKDLDELFGPIILSDHLTLTLDAPLLALSIAKYTKEDLQHILKTILEAQAPTPAPITFLKALQERSLKAWFLECEDHFATYRAKGPNQIPFPAFFLRDQINFYWQQYKHNFWRKKRWDSQYQKDDLQDCAMHLEYLQAVLKKFDTVAAPSENILIYYFWNGLRPFIQAQIDSRNQELDSWEEVLEKAIEAESKASLKSIANNSNMDARYFRGQRPTKKDEAIFSSKFLNSRDDNREKPRPANIQPPNTLTSGTQLSY